MSVKNGIIAFSPTNFIAVAIASAELSLTVGSENNIIYHLWANIWDFYIQVRWANILNNKLSIPGSFNVFKSVVVYAFNNFLFKLGEGVRAKHLAKYAAVSAFTAGFLFSNAASVSSSIRSIVI